MISAQTLDSILRGVPAPQTQFTVLKFLWDHDHGTGVGDKLLAAIEGYLFHIPSGREDRRDMHNLAYRVAKGEAELAQERGDMRRALAMYDAAIRYAVKTDPDLIVKLVKEVNLPAVTENALGVLGRLAATDPKNRYRGMSFLEVQFFSEEQKGNYQRMADLYVKHQDWLLTEVSGDSAIKFVKKLPPVIKSQLGMQLLQVAENRQHYRLAFEIASEIGDDNKANQLAQEVLRSNHIPLELKVSISMKYGLLNNPTLLEAAHARIKGLIDDLNNRTIYVVEEAADAFTRLQPLGEIAKPLGVALTDIYMKAGDFQSAYRIANQAGHPKAAWLNSLFECSAVSKAK